jgi:hypothetical protein
MPRLPSLLEVTALRFFKKLQRAASRRRFPAEAEARPLLIRSAARLKSCLPRVPALYANLGVALVSRCRQRD